MDRELTIAEMEGMIEDLWNEELDPESASGEKVQEFLAPKGFLVVAELCGPDGRTKHKNLSLSSFNPAEDEIRIYFEPKEPNSSSEFDMDYAVTSLVTWLKMAEQEGLPFVGLKWFRDNIMPNNSFHRWTRSKVTRQSVLAEAIRRGLVETGKVPNPTLPDFPTTTLKTVRQEE